MYYMVSLSESQVLTGLMPRLVAALHNKLPGTVKRITELIGPEIDRRRALINEYGKDYPGKPVSTSLSNADHH
jgi:hypothetical protein